MTSDQWIALLMRFLENASTFLVYLAIAVLFIVSIVRCVMPVLNTRRVLNRAVRSIKAGESSKRSWQEENFLGKGPLYAHWKQYLNNLFFADGEFHNPSSVDDYINEETAIYGPGRSSLAEAAPGMLTSLGFLGTLIGIAIGLQGFDMSNTDAVMDAIRTLIPGMRYAFMTSIVGVVGSILFTIITRYADGSALHALNAFYAAMSEHAGVVSVDPMTQIAIYQQEQTALIQNLSDDLNGSIANKLAGAFEKSVKPLQKSLDDFIGVTTREQLRGIDTMVTRFLQQLDQSMQNQFQHLAYTIDMTCRNQQQMQADISLAIDGLSTLSRDIVQVQKISGDTLSQFDSYLSKLNQSHKLVDDGYARIAANVEHLEIIASQQNAYLQTVGQLQNEAVRSLESFRSAADSFMGDFRENIDVSTGSLAKICEELKHASEVLATTQKTLVNGINKDMDQTYNTFFANVNSASEQLAWMIDDMKNNIAKLPDLLDGAAGLYANQSDRMTDALRRAQAALDDAVDRLTQSTGYGR